MRAFRRVFRLNLLRQEGVERDVNEELEFHLAMREARLRRSGLSGDDATRVSRERFGDVESIRNECVNESRVSARAERMSMTIDEFRRDVIFAARTLRRTPAFAAAVITTLALGIGANAMMYALLDATVLNPVSGVRDQARVFEIADVHSYPAYRELRANVHAADLAAMRERLMAIGAGSNSAHVSGAHVSGNFFGVIGVQPVLGRLIDESDDVPGNAVAVISHDYWRRAFSGDSSVLGRQVTVNGATFRVIGVAPKPFRSLHLGEYPAVWLPINSWPLSAPSSRHGDLEKPTWSWLSIVGRRHDGVSGPQLHEALTAAMLRSDPGFPPVEMRKRARPRSIQAAALGEDTREAVVRFGGIMAAVVVLVLLAACANIAGLIVARSAYRRREIGVRVALGAGRARLVRQLLTESLLLATAGAIAAMGLYFAMRAVISRVVLPGGLTGRSLDLAVDGRMLAVLSIVTLGTGVLIGLAPALESLRTDTITAIKGSAPRTRRGLGVLRGVLVTVQVATALVLLAGTALFAGALRNALAIDLGFDPKRIVTLAVDPGLVQFSTTQAQVYYENVLTSVRTVPGVRGVTWSGNTPLNNNRDFESATVDGYTPAPGDRVRTEFSVVGPDYHSVAGIRLVEGRTFTREDRAGVPAVIVVNETFARKYFDGRSAIGGRVEILGQHATVIGVARDIKYHSLNEVPAPYTYLPAMQLPPTVGAPRLIVSVSGDAAALVRPIAAEVRRVNPAVPVFGEGTMSAQLDAHLAPQLAGSWGLGVFSILAIVVAAVGIYGVVAYAVSQRTREIGIRLALGAPSLDVLRLVVHRNFAFVLIGVPIGLATALVLGRTASRFLFGVSPSSVPILAATSCVIIVIAAIATYIPARRALRVDPLLSLRADA